MHEYSHIRYNERRGDVITTYEVDRRGIPTSVVGTTDAVEGDAWNQLKGSLSISTYDTAPFICHCGWSFNSWQEVEEHVQWYCLHEIYSFWPDGSIKCEDCGLYMENAHFNS